MKDDLKRERRQKRRVSSKATMDKTEEARLLTVGVDIRDHVDRKIRRHEL